MNMHVVFYSDKMKYNFIQMQVLNIMHKIQEWKKESNFLKKKKVAGETVI